MKGLKKAIFIMFFIGILCAGVFLAFNVGAEKLFGESDKDNDNSKKVSEEKEKGNKPTDKTLLELSEMVNKDVEGETGLRYDAYKAIEIIVQYDSAITDICNKMEMSKSYVQAILLKELSTINFADIIQDKRVEEYFESNGEKNKNSSDSSTGLGQVYSDKAILVYNDLVEKGVIKEKKIETVGIAPRKEMWYKLKDDNEYNIKFVAYVLKSNAMNKRILDMKKCSEEKRKKILASYNGSGAKAEEYAEIANKYFNKFEEYNNKK